MPKTTKALDADIEKLGVAINMMGLLSQEAFESITMICNVCLTAMEKPEFWRKADTIATALLTIRDPAADAMNSINCEAEEAGLNHCDEASRRRHDARAVMMDVPTTPVRLAKVSHD